MATFAYNLNIPDAANNPSEDQPDMQENTNSIDSLINVDHYSFGESNHDGEHRQVTLPLRGGGSGTIPPGRIAGEGTLYTKTGQGETQLFYTPDASTDEYQVTRTVTGNIPTFGTFTNYSGTNSGGWTFLPGGLIMMYGTIPTLAATNTPVVFPFTFPSAVFVISLTPGTPIVLTQSFAVSGASTAGFNITKSPASGTQTVGWTAIGK